MTNGTYFKRRTLAAATCYKQLLDNECKVGHPTTTTCRGLGISRNTLQKTFRKVYGESVREYKLRIRMERSRELLVDGKALKDIAQELNYTKTRAFTSAYKKFFNV